MLYYSCNFAKLRKNLKISFKRRAKFRVCFLGIKSGNSCLLTERIQKNEMERLCDRNLCRLSSIRRVGF